MSRHFLGLSLLPGLQRPSCANSTTCLTTDYGLRTPARRSRVLVACRGWVRRRTSPPMLQVPSIAGGRLWTQRQVPGFNEASAMHDHDLRDNAVAADRIREIDFAFRASKALMSAVELGVFA